MKSSYSGGRRQRARRLRKSLL